jgi:mannose-1-phosphate guanylyltransferase
MRAFIVATGEPLEARFTSKPDLRVPLVDRPFLQHVVEYCVSQGVHVFDWILCHQSAEVEQLLGQGVRWGVEFRFHLVPSSLHPYGRIGALLAAEGKDEAVLLGHADHLASFPLAQVDLTQAATGPILFGACAPGCLANSEQWKWSGWAVAAPELLRRCCGKEALAVHLEHQLRSQPGARWIEVSPILSMGSLEEVLAANCTALREELPWLMSSGRCVEPQVRLGRHVLLDPSAVLLAPVFIGADCEIGAGARIGPNTVLGASCVIDRQAQIADAVVHPGTYVGESLELAHVVVDGDHLVARLPESEQPAVLAPLDSSGLSRAAKHVLSRLTGAVLLLAALPVLLAVAVILKLCRAGKVWHKAAVLRLPISSPVGPWTTFPLWSFCPHEGRIDQKEGKAAGLRHFFLRFLPGLINVARGDLQLVGLPPRLPGEARRLGPDWQMLYLQGRAGLVSEALLSPEKPTEEEMYAMEGVSSVAGNTLQSCALLGRYLLWVVAGWLRSAPAASAEQIATARPALEGSVPSAEQGFEAVLVAGAREARQHAGHLLPGPNAELDLLRGPGPGSAFFGTERLDRRSWLE